MTNKYRLAFQLSSILVLGVAGLGASGCTASATVSGNASGCTIDSTVDCSASAGSTGYSCSADSAPSDTDSTLSCSDPTTMADGSDGYCCIAFVAGGSSCAPDETVTGCQAGSFGYSCNTGDNPMTVDATLVCSPPTTVGSTDTFCCTDGTGTVTTGCVRTRHHG